MATYYEYVQGKLKFASLFQPDIYNKWYATIYLTPESLEKIRELQAEGLKNQLKKDEDGWYCNFSRPASKEIKGRIRGYEPPTIIMNGLPFNEAPGYGSDVKLELEVYQHMTSGGGKAKAARLKTVEVVNLVPWKKEDYNERQQKSVAALEKQAIEFTH